MKVIIEISKNNYTREEKTIEGYLVSKREYDIKYLGETMKRMAHKANPENPEKLLSDLRKTFKLFKARKFEFIKK